MGTFDSLKGLGTSYFKENLFRKPEEKPPEVHYSDKHLQIAKDLETGKIYRLDLTDGRKLLICGLSGSGKTFALRGILDRLYNLDNNIIIMTDVKDDFKNSRKPVQVKFQGGLLPGEVPQGLPIVTLRPTFFKKVTPELPHLNYWYSLNMKELTMSDFGTLMNIQETKSIPQKIAFETIFKELQKEYKVNPSFEFNEDWLHDTIDDIPELTKQSKNGIKFKFRPLFGSKLFMPKYRRNIVGMLQDDYIPCLNMESFNMFNKSGSLNMPLATLSVVYQKVISARKKKIIKPVWFVFEEVSRFVNNKNESSFKEEVIESAGLNRQYGVSEIYVPQLIEQFPPDIMKQCQYLFIPSSADTYTIRLILMSSGIANNQQTATNDSIKLKQRLKSRPYSWIAINRMTGEMNLIKFLSPLSFHAEASK